MRASAGVVFSFVASALAYQITTPNAAHGWTTAGPNTLAWTENSTDPSNFTVVLMDQNHNNQVLAALVDGTLKTMVANPPSGGWQPGSGFRVNLVQDPESLSTVLAQSPEFNISAPTGSSTTPVATAAATSAQAGATNPSDAGTPTAVPNGAQMVPAMYIQAGSASIIALLVTFLA